jgi:hypothetical protein
MCVTWQHTNVYRFHKDENRILHKHNGYQWKIILLGISDYKYFNNLLRITLTW